MNKDEFQHLSGLVDEQESDQEALLAKICTDQTLRCCWRRYHIIGDALRKNLALATDRQFPEQVMAVIDKEPAFFTSHTAKIFKFPHWTKRAAGMGALAASVAILVITMMPSRMIQTQSPLQVSQLPSKSSVSLPQVVTSNLFSTAPVIMTAPLVNQPGTEDVHLITPTSDISLAVSTTEQDAEILIPPLYGIDQYVVRHSAAVSMQHTLPYARIVGYLSEK